MKRGIEMTGDIEYRITGDRPEFIKGVPHPQVRYEGFPGMDEDGLDGDELKAILMGMAGGLLCKDPLEGIEAMTRTLQEYSTALRTSLNLTHSSIYVFGSLASTLTASITNRYKQEELSAASVRLMDTLASLKEQVHEMEERVFQAMDDCMEHGIRRVDSDTQDGGEE